MSDKSLNLLAVGDIILGPSADDLFEFSRSILRAADITVGQLEVPYTDRDPNIFTIDRSLEHLEGLVSAGFDAVTFAGNHIWDASVPGIEDTIAWLESHDIAYTGGGMSLNEARKPAIIKRDGTRVGFLAYNCVGPKETWATSKRPGCSYVHVITHYELDHATPGGPPDIYTWAESKTMKAMEEDIRGLRPLCDVLVVSFHKGIAHTPVTLAEYEHQVSYAAIDAGADLVLGHHAHILKGIEVYKRKVIFHGLGNFTTHLPLLAPSSDEDPLDWAKRRRELFGFAPDPEYPTYPFHPEAVNTFIAKCTIDAGTISAVSYLPCIVNKKAQPEPVARDEKGQQVFDYVKKITQDAGLNTQFQWRGNEVLVKVS
jgi:hypothetical protein